MNCRDKKKTCSRKSSESLKLLGQQKPNNAKIFNDIPKNPTKSFKNKFFLIRVPPET